MLKPFSFFHILLLLDFIFSVFLFLYFFLLVGFYRCMAPNLFIDIRHKVERSNAYCFFCFLFSVLVFLFVTLVVVVVVCFSCYTFHLFKQQWFNNPCKIVIFFLYVSFVTFFLLEHLNFLQMKEIQYSDICCWINEILVFRKCSWNFKDLSNV